MNFDNSDPIVEIDDDIFGSSGSDDIDEGGNNNIVITGEGNNDHHGNIGMFDEKLKTSGSEDCINNDIDAEDAVEVLNVMNNETTHNNSHDVVNNSKKSQREGAGEEEIINQEPVLDPVEIERGRRRKRRRQLHRMLQKPGVVPSFMAIISKPPTEVINVDEDDDVNDEDEVQVLPMVVIDVDKYIGLKNDHQFTPMQAPSAPAMVSSISMSSSHNFHTRSATTSNTTPAEEGWYEGTRLMAMPEDSIYLGEIQQLARQSLEYFSATEREIQMSQSGRRTPTVRGKVGIRCIHCAKAVLTNSSNKAWPAASLSYPLNISGLYSVATQKPQLHFETCPYLPHDSKLKQLLQESRASQGISSTSLSSPGVTSSKRKRMPQGMSALMYYTICCQRIGIVEIATGLRFGRDLTLEPLPFETTKLKVEHEQPQLIPKGYTSSINRASTTTKIKPESPGSSRLSPSRAAATPDRARSSSSVGGSMDAVTAAPIIADEVCQKILKEALESVEADINSGLIRKSDRILVSDFIFLAICQLQVCHASQIDFQTRGKKTKSMRLGWTGFCCKNCSSHSNYCCRSFSSAPDNLASAITNSFVLHLAKCPYTPRPIQQALSTLKRLHASQMNQMPYGSQRKLFSLVWQRLRSQDKNPSEMPKDPPAISAVPGSASSARVAKPAAQIPKSPKSRVDLNQVAVRGPGFPVSSDEATLKTLKESEDNWDIVTNDNLIALEDRNLISDYVFLTMRQLKVATPTPSDFRGNRRNNVLSRMAGMCCIHCAKDSSFTTPSGRSFPSAPDNMASALNSSLYNHMQNCPYLPPAIKHAFLHLKKLHSAQCAALAFGSQRRYFNKVYAKLKQVPISLDVYPKQDINDTKTASLSSSKRSGCALADADALAKFGFVKRIGFIPTRDDAYQCLRCRMVPFDFRALGAVHFVHPTMDVIQKHYTDCKNRGMDLTYFKAEYKKLQSKYTALSPETSGSLRVLIRNLVDDNDDLVRMFCSAMAEDSSADKDSASATWLQLPQLVDLDKVESAFHDMALDMGLESIKLSDHPEWIRFLQMISPGLDCSRYQEEEKAENNGPTATLASAVAAPVASEESGADIGATTKGEQEIPAETTNGIFASVDSSIEFTQGKPMLDAGTMEVEPAKNIDAGTGQTTSEAIRPRAPLDSSMVATEIPMATAKTTVLPEVVTATTAIAAKSHQEEIAVKNQISITVAGTRTHGPVQLGGEKPQAPS